MNKDTTGFTIIEALISIVIVCVLGGVGWVVYNRGQKSSAKDSTAQTQTNDAEEIVEDVNDIAVESNTSTTRTATNTTANPDAIAVPTSERQSIDTVAEENCLSSRSGVVWGGWSNLSADSGNNPRMSADEQYVKGSTSCGAQGENGTGYELMMKKVEGTWKVISRAQQFPAAAFCKAEGAPASWCEE